MPKGLPWFRLYAEFAFDPKMQTISETLQRRYIMLLCLKCHGNLLELNDIQLSGALRISIEELHETHKILLSIGVIYENYDIVKWSERQYVSDSSTNRVHKYRNKKRETLQKRKCNRNETPSSVSVSISKSVSFLKPTIDELTSYIKEKKYDVIPEKFFAYYESNGWLVGKNKMKSWKAALVTWHHGNYGNPKQKIDRHKQWCEIGSQQPPELTAEQVHDREIHFLQQRIINNAKVLGNWKNQNQDKNWLETKNKLVEIIIKDKKELNLLQNEKIIL